MEKPNPVLVCKTEAKKITTTKIMIESTNATHLAIGLNTTIKSVGFLRNIDNLGDVQIYSDSITKNPLQCKVQVVPIQIQRKGNITMDKNKRISSFGKWVSPISFKKVNEQVKHLK